MTEPTYTLTQATLESLIANCGSSIGMQLLRSLTPNSGEPVAYMNADGGVAMRQTVEIAMHEVSRSRFNIPLFTHPAPSTKPAEPDMFWNADDAEQMHQSIGEFLNNEICNGFVEVGAVFTIQQAKRLPDVVIKVTSIDDNESEAEYEVVAAAPQQGETK